MCFTRLKYGFRVQGSRFKVLGSGFRVQGSRFRFQVSGFRAQGSGFRVTAGCQSNQFDPEKRS
jgi:hypothetical protein